MSHKIQYFLIVFRRIRLRHRRLYTNAILEGLNPIIRNVKRRARGFRNDRYFTTMIFLTCGKLPIGLLKDANEWRRDLQVPEPATI
ncbi:MAG: transposase [Sutterella sp.]|nr:transposase [Sutterella sp.]